MKKPSPRLKKFIKIGIRLVVFGIVAWAVHRTFMDAIQQLSTRDWSFDFKWLALGCVVYLAGLLPAGLFWHRVLHRLGQKPRLGETLRAYYIGHLGKYVPGKAMVVVLRAGLIRSERVSTAMAATSVFFETLTMMAVGAFLAAGVIAVSFSDNLYFFWLAIGLMLAAGIPTIPPVFRKLAKIAGIGRGDAQVQSHLKNIDAKTLLLGWSLMGVCWLLLGVSLWAVLRGMGVSQDLFSLLYLYVGAVALAMVAGFLSLIPGGAGVRELVLFKLLVSVFTGQDAEAQALAAAVLLRLVWLVAELVLSAILYFVGARRPGSKPQEPTEKE